LAVGSTLLYYYEVPSIPSAILCSHSINSVSPGFNMVNPAGFRDIYGWFSGVYTYTNYYMSNRLDGRCALVDDIKNVLRNHGSDPVTIVSVYISKMLPNMCIPRHNISKIRKLLYSINFNDITYIYAIHKLTQ
jgi:hypothetical protein